MIFQVSGITFRSQNPLKIVLKPKCVQKRPQDAPKTHQDAPKMPQDAPKTPQEAPQAPQDAHRRLPRRPHDEAQGEPGAEKNWVDLGTKSDLQRASLQGSIFERFGVDFGRVLGWFWELLRSNFHGFYV